MNKLFYLFCFNAFIFVYLSNSLDILSGYIKYINDLICIISIIYFMICFAIKKKIYVRKAYLIVILLFILNVLIGAVVNGVGAKQFILGARSVFRYLPWFFLPLVCDINELKIINQFKLLIFLFCVQLPLVIFQRFIQYHNIATGDVITGSMLSTTTMSVVMISAISLVFSFYLKGEIDKKKLILIIICLFLPNTLNETKITLFILPLTFLIPIAIHYKISFATMRNICLLLICISIMFCIFKYFYEITMKERKDYIAVDKFLTKKNMIENYFFRKKINDDAGAVGRGDALKYAITEIKRGTKNFAFGYGLGATLESRFRGKNEIQLFLSKGAKQLTITVFLWEIGLIATIFYYMQFFLLFMDCLYLKDKKGILGALGTGWISVLIIIIMVTILYTNIVIQDILNILFWYYSGLIASISERIRMRENAGIKIATVKI